MKIYSIILTIFLVGCSSKNISFNDATKVTEERIYAFKEKTVTQTSEIIIVRNYAFGGAGCTALVSIDGKPAAELFNNEKVTLFVEAGERVLTYGTGVGFCGKIDVIDSIETSLKPNQVKYYRLIDGEILREQTQ
jgi:hypothetical protein